jgi:hypothetical protein
MNRHARFVAIHSNPTINLSDNDKTPSYKKLKRSPVPPIRFCEDLQAHRWKQRWAYFVFVRMGRHDLLEINRDVATDQSGRAATGLPSLPFLVIRLNPG